MNNSLVQAVASYLMRLTPYELTTFYCETCHYKLKTPAADLPNAPNYENTGLCSNCKGIDDVSNPYINRFLSDKGQRLDYPLEYSPNSDTTLIRDWLIPTGYSSVHIRPQENVEEVLGQWSAYGSQMSQNAYLSSELDHQRKKLLLDFYALRYSLAALLDIPHPITTILDHPTGY